MEIHQGDIYWVAGSGEAGSESGIPHPHVVIQEDILNLSRLQTVVVCALTSNRKRASLPGNVLLESGEGNLARQSVVEVSKLSTVNKAQLGELIGRLSRERVEQILVGIRFLQRMQRPEEKEAVSHPPDEALTELIQGYIDRRQILGLSIAILRDSGVTFTRGFGLASIEVGGAVTPGTLFSIGSISKTLLTMLIMRLVEAGRLDLDTPVINYLPGFRFSRRDYGDRVTLRQLLSHTSGLPGAGKDWGPPGSWALKQFIHAQLSKHSFVAEPGRIHLYSSTAITLAGFVAEEVCGRPYRELLQELVLSPLGMERTTFEHSVAMTYPLALPHEEGPHGIPRTTHRLADNAAGEPSGFAFSSTLDLANLAIMLLNRGRYDGREFLSQESVLQMSSPHGIRPMDGARHPLSALYTGYGLGLQTGVYRGERVVRHGGVSQSYNCFFELLPDLGRGMIVLSNYSQEPHLSELVVRLYDHLLGLPDRGMYFIDLPARPETPEEDGYLDVYTGAYLNVELGRLVQIRAQDQALTFEEDERVHRLKPISKGRYYFEGEGGARIPVVFILDGDQPTRFVYVAGSPFTRFTLDERFQPDRDDIRGFIGIYRDPLNLDPASTLEIRLAGDELHLTGDGADETLRPLAPGAFLSSLGLIEFAVLEDKSRVLILGKATHYHS